MLFGKRIRAVRVWGLLLAALASLTAFGANGDNGPRAWMHHVRIGAYGLSLDNAGSIARQAEAEGVYGIEVDNDIPGRYESFLDPTQKLKAIRAAAEAAHKRGNKAFVYIAGTECITANADKSPHSMAKDHPDWLQRKITGEPAIFHSGAAFWIAKGDEDAWVSFYAAGWRKIYMQRVRQIAATGIDGIYVDIPYWMTHFSGWEQSWASFDDGTVAAFKKQTGLDARHDLRLGDFSDPNFRKWVDFRIATVTDFLAEIRRNAVAVNPNIAIIPEIYPGLDDAAVRVGSDVYEIYPQVDAIAHEYEFGPGDDHTAASRSQLDWFLYQVGMRSFRAFAGDKPTWILNYSWDGQKGVSPSDAMKNLAMSELLAGANFWDAPGHSMAGSNDMSTRKQIFGWIARHDEVLNSPRTPVAPIGVYFSPKSRDYHVESFLPAYQGVLLAMLRNHLQFQIVTPRTLAAFHGKALVLPEVSEVSAAERQQLETFLKGGGKVLTTGTDGTRLGENGGVEHLPESPGRTYLTAAKSDLAAAAAPERFVQRLKELAGPEAVRIEAPAGVVAYVMRVNGAPHVYLGNFAGLVPRKVAVPIAAKGITLDVPEAYGTTLHLAAFFGEDVSVKGKAGRGRVLFVLPPVERGGVAWFSR